MNAKMTSRNIRNRINWRVMFTRRGMTNHARMNMSAQIGNDYLRMWGVWE